MQELNIYHTAIYDLLGYFECTDSGYHISDETAVDWARGDPGCEGMLYWSLCEDSVDEYDLYEYNAELYPVYNNGTPKSIFVGLDYTLVFITATDGTHEGRVFSNSLRIGNKDNG